MLEALVGQIGIVVAVIIVFCLDTMDTTARPYTKDDRERPAGDCQDGERSLHDDTNKFARKFMGLSTPIEKSPSPSEFEKAYKDVLDGKSAYAADDLEFAKQFIADLQATSREDLWPEQDHPETNTIGFAWAGAHKLMGAHPLASPPEKKKGGRKKGARTYKESELDAMLDLVEHNLPTGSKGWELIAAEHRTAGVDKGLGNSWNRMASDLRRKFEAMAAQEKPTGSNVPPRIIERAQEIHEMIENNECMGFSSTNNALEDVEMDVSGLDGTRLTDGNGRMKQKSPASKRTKMKELTKCVDKLGDTVKDSNEMLAGSINNLVDQIVLRRNVNKSNNGSDAPSQHDLSTLSRRVDQVHSEYIDLKETVEAGFATILARLPPPTDGAGTVRTGAVTVSSVTAARTDANPSVPESTFRPPTIITPQTNNKRKRTTRQKLATPKPNKKMSTRSTTPKPNKKMSTRSTK